MVRSAAILIAGDDNTVTVDRRCNPPFTTALRNGECVRGVPGRAHLAQIDDHYLSVLRHMWGNCGHQIHSKHGFQNVCAPRHQKLNLANVLSCNSAEVNIGHARRRNATGEHKRSCKTGENPKPRHAQDLMRKVQRNRRTASAFISDVFEVSLQRLVGRKGFIYRRCQSQCRQPFWSTDIIRNGCSPISVASLRGMRIKRRHARESVGRGRACQPKFLEPPPRFCARHNSLRTEEAYWG